jgi:hypothetical protein
MVNKEFIDKADKIFERQTKAIGIRLSSEENFTGGVSKSPFMILLEPLFNDDTDKKFLISFQYSSSDTSAALVFVEKLYERLKSSIVALYGD